MIYFLIQQLLRVWLCSIPEGFEAVSPESGIYSNTYRHTAGITDTQSDPGPQSGLLYASECSVTCGGGRQYRVSVDCQSNATNSSHST